MPEQNTHTSGEALGIDLGGTVYTHKYSTAFPFRGAYRVIKRLIEERFKDRTYVISRVDEEQKKRVTEVLRSDGFHELTGLHPLKAKFCAERHQKAEIARRLGITHMIDDRPEVMFHMLFVRHRILFRPAPADLREYKNRLGTVIVVECWEDIETLFLEQKLV